MSTFYISDETVEAAAAGGVGVLAAGGEIDYAASPLLHEHVARQIKAGTRRLIIDLSGATFIDSTAIGVLVGAVGSLREACGGTLAVVCVHENVLRSSRSPVFRPRSPCTARVRKRCRRWR
jgi:anti-sigma B factor antagonist